MEGLAGSRWLVVGVGNMGEALVRGIVRAGVARSSDVALLDPRDEVVAALTEALGATRATGPAAAQEADVIVLAVKPQVMGAALADLGPHVRSDAVVVSVAAGISIATIEAAMPEGTAVVRSMPNTPSLIGVGAAAYALGRHADARAAALAQSLLGSVGLAMEVPEAALDAVTALSGSGPAYIFALLEAMIAGGIAVGLDPVVARTLATQTVLGAARLAAESGVDAAELRRRVTSPNGTTAAALSVMATRGWHDALVAAIVAARDRATELGRS